MKAGARNFAPAVEILLGAAPKECRVVIEAGELRKNAPLRAVCEKAKNAAVLACYPDSEKDLPRLIDAEMQAAGLTIAPEARAALVPLLGGDRLASRSELQKLALYAHGKERVEIEDVAAVVTDASALALDALIDATFAGKLADVEFQYTKARNAGTSSGAILFARRAPCGLLHKARLAVDDGQSADSAVGGDVAALQPRAAGAGGAAGVVVGAAAGGDRPDRRRDVAVAPQRRPRRGDHAAAAAVDGDGGAAEGVVVLLPLQPPQHDLQLLKILVFEVQHSALALVVDADVKPECIRHAPLQRHGVGVLADLRARFTFDPPRLRTAVLARERFDLAHVESAVDDVVARARRRSAARPACARGRR